MEDEEVEPPLDAIVSIPKDSDGSFPPCGLNVFENLGPSTKITFSLSPSFSLPEQELQRHHTRGRSSQSRLLFLPTSIDLSLILFNEEAPRVSVAGLRGAQ